MRCHNFLNPLQVPARKFEVAGAGFGAEQKNTAADLGQQGSVSGGVFQQTDCSLQQSLVGVEHFPGQVRVIQYDSVEHFCSQSHHLRVITSSQDTVDEYKSLFGDLVIFRLSHQPANAQQNVLDLVAARLLEPEDQADRGIDIGEIRSQTGQAPEQPTEAQQAGLQVFFIALLQEYKKIFVNFGKTRHFGELQLPHGQVNAGECIQADSLAGPHQQNLHEIVNEVESLQQVGHAAGVAVVHDAEQNIGNVLPAGGVLQADSFEACYHLLLNGEEMQGLESVRVLLVDDRQ